MSSTTYNAQFLTIDFRLLDSPAFCTFMRSTAFPLYLLLRRYVWRGKNKSHPLDKVNELYADGYLVCSITRSTLAEKLGIREASHISRHLSDLKERGLLRKVRTGRQNVYVLGTWEDRSMAKDRSYVQETFFLEQYHGAEPFPQPRPDDLPPDLPETGSTRSAARRAAGDSARWRHSASDTSDVSSSDMSDVSPATPPDVSPATPSDVSPATPSNKEVNREKNRCWDVLPFPLLAIPEGIRIPIPDRNPSGGRRPSGDRAPKGGGRLLADASGGLTPDSPGGKVLQMRKRDSETTSLDVIRVVIDAKEPSYEPLYVRL